MLKGENDSAKKVKVLGKIVILLGRGLWKCFWGRIASHKDQQKTISSHQQMGKCADMTGVHQIWQILWRWEGA